LTFPPSTGSTAWTPLSLEIAASCEEVMPLAPGRRGDVTWAADRLVYTTFTSGQQSIVSVAPGGAATEEMVSKGMAPAATRDGHTIVYVSTEAGANGGVWKADARPQ